MSPHGHYRMHRGWMDNPALGGSREPFCRRAAWCWMIERAEWKPKRRTLSGKTVTLQRGQFTESLRYMAKAWGWSVGTVRRFIERLESDEMIGTATDAGQLVVTICNYSRYQADTEADGTASGTAAAQDRHSSGTATGTPSGTAKAAETQGVAGNSGTATGTPSDERVTRNRHKEERRKEEKNGGGNARERARERDVGEATVDRGTVLQPSQERTPSRPTAEHATPDPADRIADHFCAERQRLWPGNPNFPATRSSLIAQARLFLSAGATPDLVTAEVSRVMEANRAKGDPNPPTSLRFCERSVASRIAQTIGGGSASADQHPYHCSADEQEAEARFQREFEEAKAKGDAAMDAFLARWRTPDG